MKCRTCHKPIEGNRAKRYCTPQCKGRAKKLKERYKITPEQVYEIYKRQSGRCAICDERCDVWELGFTVKKPFHIDHEHYSGEVRGLLCPECNKGLGMFKDSRLLLQQAVKYLTKFFNKRKN